MDFAWDGLDSQSLGPDSLNYNSWIDDFVNEGDINTFGSSEPFLGTFPDHETFPLRRGWTFGSEPNQQTITQPDCTAPYPYLGDCLDLGPILSNKRHSDVSHTNDPVIRAPEAHVLPESEPFSSANCFNHNEALPGREKRRTVFSQTDKMRLNEAFAYNPYPPESVKEDLATQCGVHVKNINTWFVNQRARTKPSSYPQVPEKVTEITAGSESSSHQDYTPLTESSLEEMLQELENLDNKLPIERYLHTPLEEERADLSRIQLPPPAEESDESRRTALFSYSTSGPASVSSACFAGSVESVNSRGSKKGRRQHLNTFKTVTRTKDGFFRRLLKTEKRSFYCTFCGQYFRHQYEWKRHEESIHIPRRVWICAIPECPLEAFEQRIFFRKDNFFCHVRRCHGFPTDANQPTSSLYVERFGVSLAPIPADHAVLKCGFCGHQSETWQNRMTHVSKHYNKGCDLTSWWLRRLDCMYSLQPKYRNQLDRFRTRDGNDSASCSNFSGDGFSGPFSYCKDCGKSFPSLSHAVSQHPACNFWSCRYLLNAGRAFDDYDFCVYCGIYYSEKQTEQLQHLLREHNFRGCNQELFHDFQDFQRHMVEFHGSSGFEGSIHDQSLSPFHFSVQPLIQ